MADQLIVITDTSLLVNFLAIDRVELLTSLPEKQFFITEHVRAEVTSHYPEQFERLAVALVNGQLTEISVTEIAEVEVFAKLSATGLGVGECSAIAVAACRGHAIAIDDKTALKRLASLYPTVAAFTTKLIMLELVRAGQLSIADADAIKVDWQQNHRFHLPFASFAELLEDS